MRNGGYSTLFLLLFWFGVLFSEADTSLKSKFACQGDKLRIRCKSTSRIRIYAANFGRTEPGSSICPSLNTDDTSCMSPRALHIVIKKCTNKARCNIKADVTMFPDPCPKTYKYLNVIYDCVRRPPSATQAAPRKRHKTKPRYQETTTTTAWVTEYETTTTATTTTTTQPITTIRTVPTQLNITTKHWFNLSNPTKTTTPTVEFKKSKVEHTTTPMQTTAVPPPKEAKTGYVQRGEKEFLINFVVSLYLTYVILSGQPKYVLILFLSGVAIATVLLLVLLLGLHLRGRRTKQFVVQQEKEIELNDDDDDDEDEDEDDEDIDDDDDDDSEDENKNVTIAIQGADQETQHISVKPGDIIIIDSKDVDNEDSEDLGYMSEIVRYYNSRNMTQDDGKQSLTCETPSVISMPNSEAGDKREPQYDNIPKANGTCVS